MFSVRFQDRLLIKLTRSYYTPSASQFLGVGDFSLPPPNAFCNLIPVRILLRRPLFSRLV
jgi:hypothetical protein